MKIEEQVCDPFQQTKVGHDESTIGQSQTAIQAIHDQISTMQDKVEQQFNITYVQIKDGAVKQNHISNASDTLVESLQEALQNLHVSQIRHESIIPNNETQLSGLIHQNAELMSKNNELGALATKQMQTLLLHEEPQKTLNRQAGEIYRQQLHQQMKLGMRGQTSQQLQQEFAQIRGRNRDRPEIPPDQQFAQNVKNRSVESHVVILGDVIDRDGVLRCHGLLINHRRAKIRRVRRSTLDAEAHAPVSAVGAALRFQLLLIELCTHRFEHHRLTHPTFFPLQNPFRESPTDAEVRKEDTENLIRALASAASHSAHPMMTDAPQTFPATCHCCKRSMNFPTLSMKELNDCDQNRFKLLLFQKPAVLFRPMLLTDCCILYCAIPRLQPKTVERCTRITVAFLRDSIRIIAFSYIDAAVNLGDVGTKHAGSLGILDRFLSTCRFTPSFAGRRKRHREMS